MPDFEYEARDERGRLKGLISAESEEEIRTKLAEMGKTDIKIRLVNLPKMNYTYHAKDSSGNSVKGSIKGVTKFQLCDKITEFSNMGYKDFVVQPSLLSQLKNFFRFKKS